MTIEMPCKQRVRGWDWEDLNFRPLPYQLWATMGHDVIPQYGWPDDAGVAVTAAFDIVLGHSAW
jgi:hypothetical protein